MTKTSCCHKCSPVCCGAVLLKCSTVPWNTQSVRLDMTRLHSDTLSYLRSLLWAELRSGPRLRVDFVLSSQSRASRTSPALLLLLPHSLFKFNSSADPARMQRWMLNTHHHQCLDSWRGYAATTSQRLLLIPSGQFRTLAYAFVELISSTSSSNVVRREAEVSFLTGCRRNCEENGSQLYKQAGCGSAHTLHILTNLVVLYFSAQVYFNIFRNRSMPAVSVCV